MSDPKDNYRLYMENAQEMLDVAEENLRNDHGNSACNRAYYGILALPFLTGNRVKSD